MRKTLIALLSIGVLAGCGEAGPGSGPDSKPPAAGDRGTAVSKADAQRKEMEQLVADCMKKQGFQYVPDLRMVQGDNQVARFSGPSSVLESADDVRAFRQKYGFGAYAQLVYPDDPAVKQASMNPAANPNRAYVDGLDPARKAAFEKALHGTDDGTGKGSTDGGGCSGQATDKVFGKDGGAAADDAGKAAAKREYEKFRNDPEVVKAAEKYAGCLRGQGHRVDSAEPGTIETSLANAATEQVHAAGDVAPAAAKQGLEKEIKAALADLDCRADYANLARTKYATAVAEGNGAG